MYLRKSFVCLILASVVTALLPVSAAAEANPQKSFAQALAIRAPQIIEVNRSFTLVTIEKRTQKAEPGVAMYAVKATDLNRSVTDNSTDNMTKIMNNYANIAKTIGIPLGSTDAGGRLSCTLTSAQTYVLIAVKDGFTPGFTRINVVLSVKKNLQITAPGKAEAGQQVSISVSERPIFKPAVTLQKHEDSDTPKKMSTQILPIKQIPVAGVNVYAIKSTLAEGVFGQMRDRNNATTDNYTAMVKEKGFFIGTTDIKGQLDYIFKETGKYVLVAVKDGYRADFTRIGIVLAAEKRHIDQPNLREKSK